MKEFFSRIVSVWKPDFLKNFLNEEVEKRRRKSWQFWFLFNLLFALVLSAVATFTLASNAKEFVYTTLNQIPEDAIARFENGRVHLENVEPFERVYPYGTDRFYLGIDDTREDFDISEFDAYSSAFLIISDRAIIKDESGITQQDFSKIPNITLTKNSASTFFDKYFIAGAILVFLFLSLFSFFFLAGIRLLFTFYWALILMILSRLFGLKEKYSTFYFAIMNLSFVPVVVMSIFVLYQIVVPFVVHITFIILFLLNLLEWSRPADGSSGKQEGKEEERSKEISE